MHHWSAEESAIFAWVPTLTAVSRQSIFAGDPPFFFATSIATTQKEPQHWSRFWGDRGLRKSEIAYVCQKSQEYDDAFLHRVSIPSAGWRASLWEPSIRCCMA